MNTDELREELERLGRTPVPAPRPDFVEGLLTRIQLSEDLPVPAPVLQLTPRQPWARFRMVAAGAVAAALLAAIGLFSLFSGGSNRAGQTVVAEQVGSQIAEKTLKVSPDGTVTVGDEPAGTRTFEAVCREDAHIRLRNGSSVACSKDQLVELTVIDGRVEDARPLGPDGTTSEVAGSATTTAPPVSTSSTPTTAAPPSTPPTSAATNPPATASVVPATTTSTAPSGSTAPPSGTGDVTTTGTRVTFELAQVPGTQDGVASFSWPATTTPGADHFVVLRTLTQDPSADPPTPWYRFDDPTSPVVANQPLNATTYTATIDGRDIPVNTPKVSYRVAVVDAHNKLLELSTTLTLELEWKLKPAEETPTTAATSTTVPESTTTTTTSTTGTPASDPATTR